MNFILNLGFSRKQALSAALLLALVANYIAPLQVRADTATVGQAFNFTSIGTTSWTVPSGVASIKIRVWGGGGAGGNGEKINESNRSGLGGGAGGYAEKTVPVSPGDAFSITIGAGGQGIESVENGRVGMPGQESRFEGNGHTLVASGGTGGASYAGGGNPSEPIGMGGSASGGDSNQNGGNGGGYSVDMDGNPHASSGGSAFSGGNGGDRGRCGRDGHCPGSEPGSPLAQDGMMPGGGGGGSDVGQGGYGAQGQVIVEVASIVTAPANQSPRGWLDAASCDTATGWALDPDNPSASVDVHFYTDGTGTSDRFIGVVRADIHRDDVNESEGVTGDHGFSFVIPNDLKDGQTHRIYAFGIDLTEGATNNAPLLGSPKEITCAGGPTFNTATLTSNASACVARGTNVTFTAAVSGAAVTSVVLEKDTNGDNSWGEVARYDAAGTYTYTTNEPADYVGTYSLRLVINGEVRQTVSVPIVSTCGGGTTPTPVSGSIVLQNSGCIAAGTAMSFSVNAGGPASASVVLEKDTNGDNSWGAVGSWTGPVATLYTSNEPASYTGTYRLRLLVNGTVMDTESVPVVSTCGGGGGGGTTPPPVIVPITGSITTTANACVAAGTIIPFTIDVAGTGVSSVVLEKDTNGDNLWQTVATRSGAGTFTFSTNESSSYTGPYTLRLRVNNEIKATRTVQVSNNCGGTTTTEPITASLSTAAGGCVAPGTNIAFTATVAGTGINTIVLEKDTDGNGQFGQVASFTGAGTHSFTSNEAASYTGTYVLRLVVNGTVMDTESVTVSSTCGGGGTTNPPPASTGGGGGGGGRSGGPCVGYGCPVASSGTGGSAPIPGDIWIVIDNAPTAGGGGRQVTGPEQVCASGNPIRTFLKIGLDNDPAEVSKLQRFLNKYEAAGLTVSGTFDAATESAVKSLQTRYADQILSPWGVTEPTGIVYITTTRYINTVACGDSDILKDTGFGDVLEPIDPREFDGDIGVATTSTSTSYANIAGIFGALKDIPWYQILILLLLIVGGAFIITAAFKRGAIQDTTYMSLIRGASILAIATVLNVLNTLSYILNPRWFVEKTGVTLPWLLALDAVNLAAIAVICLSLLLALYGRMARENKI